MPVIEVRDLHVQFGKVNALRGLTMRVEQGDIYGFIGPNGAGKTTTLRVLATLQELDSGSVSIAGADALTQPAAVKRHIGFMPDFATFYPSLTVWEYLDFFARAYGLRGTARKQVVDAAIELTGLRERRDQLVGQLSRGLQQRVGLARLLAHDPEVMLLDEPASGLDPRARIELRQLLRDLAGLGKTIVISSHILSELEDLCSRVGIIDRGRLVAEGTASEIGRQMQAGNSYVIGVAGDAAIARQTLLSLPGVMTTTVLDGRIHIQTDATHADPGDLVRALVLAGIRVVECRKEESGLEKLFLSLTEEGGSS